MQACFLTAAGFTQELKMKWKGHRRSENVEDRRGAGMGFGLGGGRLSIGAVVIALIGGLLFGVDPLTMLSMMSGSGDAVQEQNPAPPPPSGDIGATFVSTVLADTEEVWASLMQQEQKVYQAPKLVVVRGTTLSACGRASAGRGACFCRED